tara:strand:- start:136 stop:453 length:318 start_codon:yes stop_codon:yes gene_type:complete
MKSYDQYHQITDQIAKVIAENIVETTLGQYIYVWQFVLDLVQQIDAISLNYDGGGALSDKVKELYEKHKEEENLPNGFFVRFPSTLHITKTEEDSLAQENNEQQN